MLTGLDAIELGRLRVSVGYGTHKKGRPLSPVEVGNLVQRALTAGSTLSDCARQVRIDKTGLARFLRLLKLPEDLQHLVDWGSGRGILGFSCAAELVRIKDPDDVRSVANAILENSLNGKETRQVVQLLERSGRSVSKIIAEVLRMRPVVERRYVFIGSITDEILVSILEHLSQRERDVLLEAGITKLGLVGVSGRLGPKRFTLVGSDEFGTSISKIGTDYLEERLSEEVAKELACEARYD